MLTAILVSAGLAAVLAGLLTYESRTHAARDRYLIERVSDLLPQTQCGRCTFTGCRPYAAAIVAGLADINQCPPGGDATVTALAHLLNRSARPLDARFGTVPAAAHVAWIDEAACIGCAKCILACPVDAIVGAARFMHTVIAEQCTGCELCIPPCPVDCIEMRPASGSGGVARAVSA